ncbi:GNAT family N-acetyltransferase [Lysobacter sp. HA18]
MTTTVRNAHVDDARAIAALSGQLGYAATEQQMAERLSLLADDAHGAAFVAEVDADVVGWIAVARRLTIEYGITFEITGLVVDASRRRTGAGRLLVQAAEQWAQAHGGDALVVRSNAARELSHVFYEGIGFTRTKTQHVYRRDIDRG